MYPELGQRPPTLATRLQVQRMPRGLPARTVKSVVFPRGLPRAAVVTPSMAVAPDAPDASAPLEVGGGFNVMGLLRSPIVLAVAAGLALLLFMGKKK